MSGSGLRVARYCLLLLFVFVAAAQYDGEEEDYPYEGAEDGDDGDGYEEDGDDGDGAADEALDEADQALVAQLVDASTLAAGLQAVDALKWDSGCDKTGALAAAVRQLAQP